MNARPLRLACVFLLGASWAAWIGMDTLSSRAWSQEVPARVLGRGPSASSPSTHADRAKSSFPLLTPESASAAATDLESVDSLAGEGFAAPAITVTSSLAIVLGLFAGMIWLTRKFASRSLASRPLPAEAIECLGSTAIDPRTRVSLLRCGERILVVAQTATGIHRLSEITHADEVRRLTAICSGSSPEDFASTLASLEAEDADDRYADASTYRREPPPTPNRLFTTA